MSPQRTLATVRIQVDCLLFSSAVSNELKVKIVERTREAFKTKMSLSEAAVMVLALEKNVADLNVFHAIIMNKSLIHFEHRLHMYLAAHLVFVQKSM